MIKFLYKYGLISILSFLISNILFYFFEKIFNPSIASLITIIIIFMVNTQLLFKAKLFNKNKKNYYKLLTLSISFRVFEYLLFNILYLFILTDLKTNYIFFITLVIGFLLKFVVYYKSSLDEKNIESK